MTRALATGVVCALVVLVSAGCGSKSGVQVGIDEERLAEWPDRCGEVKVSSDGCHVAFVALRGSRRVVVHDGQELGDYDQVYGLKFSPNGEAVAYIAATPEGRRVYYDGPVGAAYEQVQGPTLSEDGDHIAFKAERGGKCLAVIDGAEQQAYDGVADLAFSRDGERFAYVAVRAGMWFVVVDGKEQSPYDAIDDVCFNPEGTRFAYRAYRSGGAFVVVEGKESPPYTMIGKPVFSPAGGRVAYWGHRGREAWCVIDGHPGPAFTSTVKNSIRFSSDGSQVAYVASRGSDNYVVYQGKLGPRFDSIDADNVLILPNTGHLIYWGERNGKWHIVVNDEVGPGYDGLSDLVTAEECEHWAVVARKGDKQAVIVDGEAGRWYEVIDLTTVQFTPDVGDVAYVAVQDGKSFLVLGDEEQPLRHTGIPDLCFTYDGDYVYHAWEGQWDAGKHLVVVAGRRGPMYDGVTNVVVDWEWPDVAYVARKGVNLAVVLNEERGPWFDRVLDPGPSFKDDGTLQYLGVRDGVLYRVTHTPLVPEWNAGPTETGRPRQTTVAVETAPTPQHRQYGRWLMVVESI